MFSQGLPPHIGQLKKQRTLVPPPISGPDAERLARRRSRRPRMERMVGTRAKTLQTTPRHQPGFVVFRDPWKQAAASAAGVKTVDLLTTEFNPATPKSRGSESLAVSFSKLPSASHWTRLTRIIAPFRKHHPSPSRPSIPPVDFPESLHYRCRFDLDCRIQQVVFHVYIFT